MTTKTSLNMSTTQETTKMTSPKSQSTANVYTTEATTSRVTTKMMSSSGTESTTMTSPTSETQTLHTRVTTKLPLPTTKEAIGVVTPATPTSGTTAATNISKGEQFFSYSKWQAQGDTDKCIGRRIQSRFEDSWGHYFLSLTITWCALKTVK